MSTSPTRASTTGRSWASSSSPPRGAERRNASQRGLRVSDRVLPLAKPVVPSLGWLVDRIAAAPSHGLSLNAHGKGRDGSSVDGLDSRTGVYTGVHACAHGCVHRRAPHARDPARDPPARRPPGETIHPASLASSPVSVEDAAVEMRAARATLAAAERSEEEGRLVRACLRLSELLRRGDGSSW